MILFQIGATAVFIGIPMMLLALVLNEDDPFAIGMAVGLIGLIAIIISCLYSIWGM